jgi:surface antigen
VARRLLPGAALALVAGCAGLPPAEAPASSPAVPDAVVQRALERSPSGEALRWRIAETGQHGTVTPIRTFRTASGICREYAVTSSVPDGTGHAWRDVACRDQAGSWRPTGVGA